MHKLASVTVTVYVAGERLEIPDAVLVFDHKYVNPPVPPDGVTVIDPLLLPQVELVLFKLIDINEG